MSVICITLECIRINIFASLKDEYYLNKMDFAVKIKFGESTFLLLVSEPVFKYSCRSLKEKYH